VILTRGGTIGVRVLDEFAAVAARQRGLAYAEIREVLEPVRAVCAVEPIAPRRTIADSNSPSVMGFPGTVR